ncbi:MAG: pilus assembly protein [Actinomycetales bacterium]|uniref:Pilus assembly protein n=1 Tax=Candidatus Phosphoribacter hodrii TaxID=2953743 RepID=A0A934X1Z6_9MICO|nr:pilus assembly protein [Candidatus Phosphoribacter hodrii]
MRWVRLRVGRPDQGRAIVEFVFLGVLLLVPLIYLVMTLAVLRAAACSGDNGGSRAGRAFTTAPAEAKYAARQAATQVAFEDFGFVPEETSVAITCDGSPCLRPDARVSVTTSIRVRLPYLPAFLGDAVPAAIPVSATHVATVGRFGGS